MSETSSRSQGEPGVPSRVAALSKEAAGHCLQDQNSSMTLYRDSSVCVDSEDESSQESNTDDDSFNVGGAAKPKGPLKYRDVRPHVSSNSEDSDDSPVARHGGRQNERATRPKDTKFLDSSDSEESEDDSPEEPTKPILKGERQKLKPEMSQALNVENVSFSDSSSDSDNNNSKLKKKSNIVARKTRAPAPAKLPADDSDSSDDSSDSDSPQARPKTVARKRTNIIESDSESDSDTDTEDDCMIVGVESSQVGAKTAVTSSCQPQRSTSSSSSSSTTSSSSTSPLKRPDHSQHKSLLQNTGRPGSGSSSGPNKQTLVLDAAQLKEYLAPSVAGHGKTAPLASSSSDRGTVVLDASRLHSTSQPAGARSLLKPADATGSSQSRQAAPSVVMKPAAGGQLGGHLPGQSSGQKEVKVIKVSGEASRELVKNMNQKTELSRRLEQQKKVLTSVNLRNLPDGGHKLRQLIDDMTTQLGKLEVRIQEGQQQVAQQAGLGQGQKVTVLPQRHTVAGQALPSGVRQTKLTDHALPSHVYQQMFAANPQAMTLYGGRMTAARLQQVGDVTAEAIERIHKQLETCPAPEEEMDDPRGIQVPLMMHQRQAMAWLNWREQQQPPGGILADDMGLGKTLTMISLIVMSKYGREGATEGEDAKKEWLGKQACKELIKSRATLVVCPASLVHQWYKEIEKRCQPDLLSVILYHGSNRETNKRKLAKADVVLTTYNIISKEVGVPEEMKKNKKAQEMAVSDKMDSEIPISQQPLLLRIAWERIILDEAHNIKNCKSLTAMSVCRLRALYRWALTGTPIQNDLLDMYSLLRFLRCSPFDELKVWKRQVDNKSANGTKRLNTLMKSLLLRRTKDQANKEGKPLVSLPPRKTVTHELELGKQEREVYEKIFSQSRATMEKYLERHEEKLRVKQGLGPSATSSSSTNPWSKQDVRPGFTPASQVIGSASQANQSGANQSPGANQNAEKPVGAGQMLLLLLRLRQCCGHLSLMKDALDVEGLQTDGVELDIVEQMQGLILQEEQNPEEPTATVAKKASPVFEVGAPSAKIKALLEHMRDVKAQSPKGKPMKSVIVSQWTKMLEVAQHHLVKEGFRCCTIKGDIPAKKRMEVVEAFNSDPRGPEVMLLSLRAGGVGLNLVGGNHLFLIDMHWNPALEQQASDRIYRVGQTKDVFIHRFICKETVEEKILQLQKRKLSLASNVLTGAGAAANKLTLADLRMLFGLDNSQKHLAGQQNYPHNRPL